MKSNYLKLLGLLIVLLLVVNLVLFALKIIAGLLFWAIIIVAAIFAYKFLPKIVKGKK